MNHGRDGPPDPGGSRDETAKDERDEHDREADDASANVASHGARHFTRPGVSLPGAYRRPTLRT
jgi:hypothetical protein